MSLNPVCLWGCQWDGSCWSRTSGGIIRIKLHHVLTHLQFTFFLWTQISSDITSSPLSLLSSTAIKTPTSKGLLILIAWRLNKSACNSVVISWYLVMWYIDMLTPEVLALCSTTVAFTSCTRVLGTQSVALEHTIPKCQKYRKIFTLARTFFWRLSKTRRAAKPKAPRFVSRRIYMVPGCCIVVVVVVVVVFTLNRSFYPTTSAAPPVSFLILYPREILKIMWSQWDRFRAER